MVIPIPAWLEGTDMDVRLITASGVELHQLEDLAGYSVPMPGSSGWTSANGTRRTNAC